MNPAVKKRILLTVLVLAALVAAPWIFGAGYIIVRSIHGKFDEWRYQPTADFKSSDWQERGNGKYRYAVLDHVATKIIKPGMSAAEVRRLLGQPDAMEANLRWQYEAIRPGWRLIDFSGGGLSVEFDLQGRVIRASRNTWVD